MTESAGRFDTDTTTDQHTTTERDDMTDIYLTTDVDTDTTAEHPGVTETVTAHRAAVDAEFWHAYRETIADASARTIAIDWHSPASALSQLSHGMPFDVDDVADAVDVQLAELREDGVDEDTETPSPRGGWTADDLVALLALAAWLEDQRR